MSDRRPSAKWSEVGAPRKGRPRRRGPEQWVAGFGYGFGAVVTMAGDEWRWRISDGAGRDVRQGSSSGREAAMIDAEDNARAVLVGAAEGGG